MQEIVQHLKTYLIENYGEKKDLLFFTPLSVKEAPQKILAPIDLKPRAIPAKKIEPQPVSKEPEEIEVVEPPPSFIAEKPQATTFIVDHEMVTLYKKIQPHLKIFDAPLQDDIAKQIRMASNKRSELPEIPVLFDHVIQKDLDFLTSLAKAINTSFGTSSVVHIHEFEEKNLWKPLLAHSNIRLIIIPSSLLKHSPNLLAHIKEYPGRLLKSVEKIPLLALSDISNSPIRKKEIWSTLTRFFKKPSI